MSLAPGVDPRPSRCRRKRRYSRAAAIRVVNRIRDTRGIELEAYRCRVCGRVHVARRTGTPTARGGARDP